MKLWSVNWMFSFWWLVFALTTTAEQVQYYDQHNKYGLAITSTITGNGTEVIIQLSAPTSYGWAAVGTGSHMDGSVQFFIYPSDKANQVTLSIRQAVNHLPIRTLAYQTSLLKSSIQNGIMSATIRWTTADRTFGGKLDIGQHKQPFIWALGPNQQIASSDENFNLLEHPDDIHGVLVADMPYSQNPSSVEADLAGATNTVNIKAQAAIYNDLVKVHAFLLCGCFGFIFPFGVIGLRWRWSRGFLSHWIAQTTGVIVALAGLGIAITQSIIGVVHNDFMAPHQLVGILVCIFLPIQAWFGYAQHMRNKVYKKWTWASWWHVICGRVLICGGMLNIALGLLLVGLRLWAAIAGGICVIVIVLMEIVTVTAARRRRRTATRTGQPDTRADYHKLQDITVTQDELRPQN